MNTLSYSGKLKKIYSASEVIEFIKKYVMEKGLSYELLEEQCILVDFGIETEGIGFSFQGLELKEQVAKHAVDDKQKFMGIYELLYELRNFFYALNVQDEFAIWDEYCYSKEPVKVALKELTLEQKELMEHIDFTGCEDVSVSTLWSVIDLYIWNRAGFVEENPGTWSDMVKKIPEERFRCMGLWGYHMISLWIREVMAFKGKPVKEYDPENKSLMTAISVAQFSLMENLGLMWSGSVGKKQIILAKMFAYEDKKYQKEHHGKHIITSAEHSMRILFTTLDYLGFTFCEKVEFPTEKIKAARFVYTEIV